MQREDFLEGEEKLFRSDILGHPVFIKEIKNVTIQNSRRSFHFDAVRNCYNKSNNAKGEEHDEKI